MIELTSLKCPECGASLDIPEERDHIFCQYCGTKILLTNDNEKIIRHVDEAAIKQAENESKRLDIEERKRKAETYAPFIILGVSLTLLFLMIFVSTILTMFFE